jgi:hypothetical protein
VSVQTDDASISTVGGICHGLAYWHLHEVFQQHMPNSPGKDGWPISVYVGIHELADWRKERASKSLYRLQIEVGEKVLQKLSNYKGVSDDEKNLARKKIEAEIEKLRRTKQPIFAGYTSFRNSGPSVPAYTPRIAERIREAVRKGSSETIEIVK